MTPKALRDEVLRLPPQERLKLLEDIWDSLTPEDIPIPDWHKEELDRRLDDPASGPGLTWEEVRAKLNDRKRVVTYRLEFRPEASADVAEAFSWYEAQRPCLGAEF